MRVVFISEDGLPDFRVEKMMNTVSTIFDEIHFIGKFRGYSGFELVKQPVIHSIEWSKQVNLFIEPWYSWTRRRVVKIIKSLKPDLVIAVNLVSASMIDDLDVPLIIDYHEVWSLLLKYIKPPSIPRKIIKFLKEIKYPEVEKRVLPRHPLITFSKGASEYFRERLGVEKIVVAKNFPSRREIHSLLFRELKCDKKILVYIGKKTLSFDGQTYRDIRPSLKALEKLWENRRSFELWVPGLNRSDHPFVKPLGWIKHVELYRVVSEAHVGMLSYAPSPIQYLVDPNKIYIYMHGGAIPVVTSTHTELLETIENNAFIIDADNYWESLLNTFNEILDMDCILLNEYRRKIFEYSKNKLVWENQEKTLIDFIKKNM